MIRHFMTRQFARFLFVGGTAAFVNWLSCRALGLWFSFSLSVVLAYFIGVTTAFFLNRGFVFSKSDRPIAKQARDFVLVNILFLPVVLFFSIFLEKLFISFGVESYGQALAHGFSVGLPAILSFLFYKFLAFKEAADDRN